MKRATSTTTNTRSNKKWTVTECLQLQREYELLGLSVNEIAARHKRTSSAIMFKLDQEGFADYNILYDMKQSLVAPCNVNTNNDIVADEDVLETKIDYLVAGVEPKLLAEMKAACESCEQLLKKMRYFTQGSSQFTQTQTQSKNRLSMY
jgi:hypothetical protein